MSRQLLRTGGGLVGTAVGLALGFMAGAGTQEHVNVVPEPLQAEHRPAALEPGMKVSDICLDPNAVVQHINGTIPRTQISLRMVNFEGRVIDYTVTVSDGQELGQMKAAIETSVDGAEDPDTDTAPVDDALLTCMVLKKVEREETLR